MLQKNKVLSGKRHNEGRFNYQGNKHSLFLLKRNIFIVLLSTNSKPGFSPSL